LNLKKESLGKFIEMMSLTQDLYFK